MNASTPPLPATTGTVAIVMATYEGARFLPAQLDSFAAQDYSDWSLLISDDSTGPATADTIETWCNTHPDRHVTLLTGPRRGFARNFLSLLAQAPAHARFVALSDQDDVWFPDKLSRAVAMLGTVAPDRPALYCAATTICDDDLGNQHPSPVFKRAPAFANAMVQSIGGGNTMVLNRAALDLAQACLPPKADPVAHDWWLYQIISGHGGLILRDDAPVLLYRQHDANVIGTNISAKDRFTRLRALLSGRFRDWNSRNLAALETAAKHLSPQARHTLTQFSAARSGPVHKRLRALRASGVFRQSSLGTAALYIACLLNRL